MRTVWKFHVPATGSLVPVEMPKGALILSAGYQPDDIGQPKFYVWALVDPDESENKTHMMLVVGTGSRVPDGGCYHVGRVTIDRRNIGHGFHEFHVFEVMP